MKMTTKTIEANCTKIAADSLALDALIQTTGLGVLDHVDGCGNPVLVNRLYNSLGRGHRKTALAEWLLAFGKVKANDDSKTKKDMPFLLDKSKTTDLTAAFEKPWFEFKPEPTPDLVFDLHAKLQALLRGADKAQTVEGYEFLGELRVMAEAMAKAKATPDTVLGEAVDPLTV